MLKIQKMPLLHMLKHKPKWMVFLAVLCAVSLFSLIHAPHASAITTIRVTVRNTQTNAPISNAVVQITGDGGSTGCMVNIAVTNAAGVAYFSNCTSGVWVVLSNVVAAGYSWQEHLTTPDWNFQTSNGAYTDVVTYATLIPPAVGFSSNTTSVAYKGSAILTWNVAFATSCTASGATNWTGSRASSGSQTLTNLTSTATYTLSCSGNGGTTKKSVTINVAAPPPPSSGSGSSGGSSGGSNSGSSSKPSNKKPSASPKPSNNPAPVVTGNTSDTSPPSKPSNLEANAEKHGIVLSWFASTDDVGVTGYSVERSTDQENWELIDLGVEDTTYVDEYFEPETEYYYRVRAYDASNNQSEAVVSGKVLSAATVISKAKPETPVVAKKSSSGGVVATIGTILVLAALAGGVWYLRRRNAQALMASQYDYGYNAAPPQPQQTQQPLAPPLQPAEHTSVSLKDMVLQDYHPEDADKQNRPGPPEA